MYKIPPPICPLTQHVPARPLPCQFPAAHTLWLHTPPPGGSGVLVLSISALFWWEAAPGAQEGDSFSPLGPDRETQKKETSPFKDSFPPSFLLLLPLIFFSVTSFFEGGANLQRYHLNTISFQIHPWFYIWYTYLPLEGAGEHPSVFYQLWFRLPAKASRACWETELGPFTGEDKQVISAPVLNDLTI